MANSYKYFEQFLTSTEVGVEEHARNWSIAIGLQDVDRSKPSEFLFEQAKANIEGKILSEEVGMRLENYYSSKSAHERAEADGAVETYRVTKLKSQFKSTSTQYQTVIYESSTRSDAGDRVDDVINDVINDIRKDDKRLYLEVITRSVADSSSITALLQAALTDRITDHDTFTKGIDYSYYYEKEG